MGAGTGEKKVPGGAGMGEQAVGRASDGGADRRGQGVGEQALAA